MLKLTIKHITRTYRRFTRRKDPQLPNKCDYCALRVEYSEDEKFDLDNSKVAELAELGLATYAARSIIMSGPTSFCVIENKKHWRRNHKRCPDWQRRLPEQTTSLSDHLAIHHTLASGRAATKWQIIALVFAVLSISVAIAAIWISHNDALAAMNGSDLPRSKPFNKFGNEA